MSASSDHWDAYCDREFERIMKLSDEEILAEMRLEGLDPEKYAAEWRKTLLGLIERMKQG